VSDRIRYQFYNDGMHQYVKEYEGKYKVDVREKIYEFALNCLKFLMKLPYKREIDIIRNQLAKSATSIGANFEEAQSTTYKEFVQKLRISLREANESKYWLRLLRGLEIGDLQTLEILENEISQISKILGAIVSRSHKKAENG
jgi:four helix bundle protein